MIGELVIRLNLPESYYFRGAVQPVTKKNLEAALEDAWRAAGKVEILEGFHAGELSVLKDEYKEKLIKEIEEGWFIDGENKKKQIDKLKESIRQDGELFLLEEQNQKISLLFETRISREERRELRKNGNDPLESLRSLPVKELNRIMNLRFIEMAMKRKGEKTYVWAGKYPEIAGGTDCSGTVDWAIRQIIDVWGIGLKTRNANMQATDPDFTVEGDDSPGTLNFYDWKGKTKIGYDHVTVNLGNGKELNPYGGEINTIDNPAKIWPMNLTVLKPGHEKINRQLNWRYILFDIKGGSTN
jgi:hypothetical protein